MGSAKNTDGLKKDVITFGKASQLMKGKERMSASLNPGNCSLTQADL